MVRTVLPAIESYHQSAPYLNATKTDRLEEGPLTKPEWREPLLTTASRPDNGSQLQLSADACKE